MENIIYNELRMRGYKVDVGVIEHRTVNKEGEWQRKQLEVDFVVNSGSQRVYIQSALALPTEEKRQQESASLLRVQDSFKKLIIVRDDIRMRRDENGIITISLFNLKKSSYTMKQIYRAPKLTKNLFGGANSP